MNGCNPQGGGKKRTDYRKTKEKEGGLGKERYMAQQWVTSFSTDHEHGKKLSNEIKQEHKVNWDECSERRSNSSSMFQGGILDRHY